MQALFADKAKRWSFACARSCHAPFETASMYSNGFSDRYDTTAFDSNAESLLLYYTGVSFRIDRV